MQANTAVFALMETSLVQPSITKTFIKWDINEDNILLMNLISQTSTPDSSYNIFLDKFVKIYEIAFLIKEKYLSSPWITQGLKKSSKRISVRMKCF